MSNCQINQPKASCGCGSEGEITDVQPTRKELTIDFMYLDLAVCTRCQGTEQNLNEALHEVGHLLSNVGFDITVNNILVESEAQAEQLQFESSPTIRINGQDIQLTTKESNCASCGTIVGEHVDCRVWEYDGKEYTTPPKSLLIDAILKKVYSTENHQAQKRKPYVPPENIKNFFKAKKAPNQEDCCNEKRSAQCC
ncbi:DUF2703 domain-containing protein [Salinibacillus xinjiangensis]|uniref:DUF2703 domain-containing protein n=1 Tax=Salinibacillus xinjiangensis TaxID=1229268 RepID=A0A6G1XB38_9BACI|nr:DUF2703 domain-containing protein [Salinibacillus xinjiangensis]MRG88125.1 DUF2703 domain-containing protein [Salinibacillus xinjiangensis]